MDTLQIEHQTDTVVDKVDCSPKGVPPAYQLLKEMLGGTSPTDLAIKYNCSNQNIHKKINLLIKNADPEFQAAYMKSNIPVLKAIEALHLQESINPDRNKKLSGYQLTGMAKLVWEMRRTEEGKSTQINESTDLIVSLQAKISEFKPAE